MIHFDLVHHLDNLLTPLKMDMPFQIYFWIDVTCVFYSYSYSGAFLITIIITSPSSSLVYVLLDLLEVDKCNKEKYASSCVVESCFLTNQVYSRHFPGSSYGTYTLQEEPNFHMNQMRPCWNMCHCTLALVILFKLVSQMHGSEVLPERLFKLNVMIFAICRVHNLCCWSCVLLGSSTCVADINLTAVTETTFQYCCCFPFVVPHVPF